MVRGSQSLPKTHLSFDLEHRLNHLRSSSAHGHYLSTTNSSRCPIGAENISTTLLIGCGEWVGSVRATIYWMGMSC